MDNKMKIDERILSELARYNSINKYISEQDIPGEEPLDAPPADAALPPAGAEPTAPAPPIAGAAEDTTPVDTETDPDVEKIDDSGETETGSEELDITDLVNSQKNVETKQEEYFQNLFSHLENLESKLAEMDNIVNMLNSMEQKIEKYRPKTPQEKLELRSLDSGPYNQKLSDFFVDKEQDMQKSGKNEYILTTDDVEDYSPLDISKTFRDFDTEQLPMK